MFRIRLLITFILLIPCLSAVAAPMGWDFETGDLQGWAVVSGNVGQQPSNNDNDRWDGNFDKQGKWFLGTYESGGDELVGTLQSPVFNINADMIYLRVGGGAHANGTYAALVLVDGEIEILKASGQNREQMAPVVWDVAKYHGQQAFIRVVDRETGGWGHVNVDDIHELTPVQIEEYQALLKAEAERIAEMQRKAETNYQIWRETVFDVASPRVYKAEYRDAVTMPLGGIGAGNIAICGDGALRQWQVINQCNSGAQVPYGFLGVTAQAPGKPQVSRILQTAQVDNLPVLADNEFIGEFPIARVNALDEALPIAVDVKAFTSLTPMEAEDSGLPVIYFLATTKNNNTQPVDVSLMMSAQNFIGWDGAAKIDGVRYEKFGGNVNSPVKDLEFAASYLQNPSLSPQSRNFGTMALGCLDSGATMATQWDDSAKMWADFTDNGRFDNPGPMIPSETTRTYNTALARSFTLQPGETVTIPFVLAWHFPNRYAEYDQNLSKYRLGNHYNTRFDNALDVLKYAARKYADLRDSTLEFHDTFYDSNLPYWFLDCVSSQISTLTSQTCLWIEDGTFHAFEGTGCCPMNCTHVWNYEQTLAFLWPELERNMRDTDLHVQQAPEGFIHHRTVLPLSLPRGSGAFVDGHLSTISKAYRDYRMCADDNWLKDNWPHIKKAMDWAMDAWDADGNGVLEGEQWNTYDCAVWGPNTFIGGQWLAALKASQEMALLMGEPEAAARYAERFNLGMTIMDKNLWNGQWWIQDVDLQAHPVHQYATGCHSDQLMGQWWARVNGLGGVFPQEHVDIALDSIFKYNFMKTFEGFNQNPRVYCAPDDMGLLICTWPQDGRPEQQVTLYSDEVWTGIEYEVAGLMLYEGQAEAALQIVKAARDRYDGRVKKSATPGYNGAMRSPWNETECGEHYARPMSSWSLLLAATGQQYDGPAGSLGFAPNLQPDNLRAFFSVAEGWGTFRQNRQAGRQFNSITLKHGKLGLNQFKFIVPENADSVRVSITIDGQKISADITKNANQVTLNFKTPQILTIEQELKISTAWDLKL